MVTADWIERCEIAMARLEYRIEVQQMKVERHVAADRVHAALAAQNLLEVMFQRLAIQRHALDFFRKGSTRQDVEASHADA